MTKTYAQLTQEIEVLRQQAEEVWKEEVAGVIGRIKEAIAYYGLTADDLGLGTRASRGNGAAQRAVSKGARRKKATQRAPSTIKYRDEAGRSWTGMGPQPGWLKAALAAGASLESVTVGIAASSPPTPKAN
jgi:DNA-binding protein H-NS